MLLKRRILLFGLTDADMRETENVNLSHVFWRRRFESGKHDSARSHLQPWPEELKLIVFIYLTQHHE